MTKAKYPDKKAFKQVYTDIEAGSELTLEMVGNVFGQAFWMMLVYVLMDSNDAARAIAGAISRLKGERDGDS